MSGTSETPVAPAPPGTVKACCARLYEADWVRLLLGDSFHPGGLALTERLGRLLELAAGGKVLDVASGSGSTAIHLARTFGCGVVGVDYSSSSVSQATALIEKEGLTKLVSFHQGDAESLPYAPDAFDALICECAFCTFPDKRAAAREFYRVLRPGGRVGLSDLTRRGPVPAGLDSLPAWIACLDGALHEADYVSVLESAGFDIQEVEVHDSALMGMIADIRGRLVAAELLGNLGKFDLPGLDLAAATALARRAQRAVEAGSFGYLLIVARKPEA